MAEWKSISLVPTDWREPFTRWAQNELVATRAAIAFQDRYDPDAMWDAQLESIRGGTSPSAEEWIAKLASIPIVRNEIRNAPIDPVIWQHIQYGVLHWDSASFHTGRGPREVKDNLVGIEFDAVNASRLGLNIGAIGETHAGARKGGRSRSDQWNDWIAYLVIAANDLDRTEGPEKLMDKVADLMALDGIEPMKRSTVQPAAQAIIALLEKKRL